MSFHSQNVKIQKHYSGKATAFDLFTGNDQINYETTIILKMAMRSGASELPWLWWVFNISLIKQFLLDENYVERASFILD